MGICIIVPVFGGAASCMLRLFVGSKTKVSNKLSCASSSLQFKSYPLPPVCLTKTHLASLLGLLTVVKFANTVSDRPVGRGGSLEPPFWPPKHFIHTVLFALPVH